MAVAAMHQSSLPCSVDHYIERVHQDAARTQPVQLRCDLPPFHRRTHLERKPHSCYMVARRPEQHTANEPQATTRHE